MENNQENNVDTQTTEKNEVKTFTQEEVNNIVQERLAKAKKNMPTDEELNAYKTWKESQKTEQDKFNNLQASNNALSNELNILKTQIKVNESGVKKEFSKFVTSEIISLVNDTTDFDTALKDYKKDNPQYFGETTIKKVQTSPSLSGGGNQPQTTNDIMNNFIRNN